MQRAIPDLFGKDRGHGGGGGDKALHVTGAAPVEMAVMLNQLERIAGPILFGDGHHVGVP